MTTPQKLLIAALTLFVGRAHAVNATYCPIGGGTAIDSTHNYINGILINPQNGHAWTYGCIPPNLQAVEATSFSILFKLKDSDANTPYVVALYTSSGQATGSPARFINSSGSGVCDAYWDTTSSPDPACYQKVTFTGLTPGWQYYYNVDTGVNGTCNGSSCSTCNSSTSTCAISGGNWFDLRRPVKAAPAPVAGSNAYTHIVVMGDSRNGTQAPCGSDPDDDGPPGVEGYWFPANSVECGGSGSEREDYGTAIAAFHASHPINLVVHGGDIASSDSLRYTMTYWADMESYWRDVSTSFAFGNHEFYTLDEGANPGKTEVFGTHHDTLDDDMIAVPRTPVSLGSPAYQPSGASTYYSQNYGNVHIAYLNAQLCPLLSQDDDPDDLHTFDKCADGTTNVALGGLETSSFQPCGCWTLANNQRNWLINDLKAANADPAIDWIFVSQHKAYWSNGPYAQSSSGNWYSAPEGQWTNTLGRQEYFFTSDGDPDNLTQPARPYTQAGLKPLDALYQMYNVDLVLSSHAHYYEIIKDARYREPGDSLPHMLIGGSGSAEQLYQCPIGQIASCELGPLNFSSINQATHLPQGVTLEHASDSTLFIGDLAIYGNVLFRNGYPVEDGGVGSSISGGIMMTSRKAQIRADATKSTSRFNGCNVPYPPSNPGGNIPDTNCTVH